jgi:hypothetical protein
MLTWSANGVHFHAAAAAKSATKIALASQIRFRLLFFAPFFPVRACAIRPP